MPTIKEIIEAFFNEIKAIMREYVHEQEAALKKRLKNLLITSIIISILVSRARSQKIKDGIEKTY